MLLRLIPLSLVSWRIVVFCWLELISLSGLSIVLSELVQRLWLVLIRVILALLIWHLISSGFVLVGV